MGKCVHRLNLDLIANLAHELWQTDIFAHRRHTIVAGSRCALLTDVLANLCGDILAHLLRLCHLLFCTQWHFFLIANFSRDLSAVVPGHQHANVALHVFGHIVADILCFVAALGHSHRVARLHRDNFAHVLLERHLNILAEGRWFEGALLFLFFPGDIFDHPSLHLLALLSDDVSAHVLVDLLAHVADHPPAFLHLLRGARWCTRSRRPACSRCGSPTGISSPPPGRTPWWVSPWSPWRTPPPSSTRSPPSPPLCKLSPLSSVRPLGICCCPHQCYYCYHHRCHVHYDFYSLDHCCCFPR